MGLRRGGIPAAGSRRVLNRDRFLTMVILIVIGAILFGMGLTVRRGSSDAVSLLPTLTPTALPPTPTPRPTYTTTPTPTVAPSATPTPGTVTLVSSRSAVIAPEVTPGAMPTFPTSTPTAPPLKGVVASEAGLMLRSAPNTSASVLSVFLQGVEVSIVARSDDKQWVKVTYQGQEGWLAAEFLTLSGDLNGVPVDGPATDIKPGPPQPCVSVVGDSLAYGEVIFELPTVGFIKAKLAPFSQYIERQLTLHGISGLTVTDRSYPGIGISSAKHTSYYDIPAYPALLQDHCAYTLVLPWVNDLSSGEDPITAAPEHAAKMVDLVHRLVSNTPQGKLLIVNYYQGAPAAFSIGMANGFTPAAIQMFNEEITKLCTTGELSKFPQVLCIDSQSVFAEIGTAYVIGPVSRSEMESLLIKPLDPNEQEMLDFYTKTKPNGQLIGDGIHLNSIGKTVLAAYLTNLILDDRTRTASK